MRSKTSSGATKRPAPKPTPDYIDTLPEHLGAFGAAVWRERDVCRRQVDEAMKAYDEAVYDAVLDATPKDVLEVMKTKRESVLATVDDILSIACSCAGDQVSPPSTLAGVIEEDAPREAGETIGAVCSDMHANAQEGFLQGFVDSLTPDARNALWATLDRLP